MVAGFDFEDNEDWDFPDTGEVGKIEPKLALRDNEQSWLDAYRRRLSNEFPGLVQQIIVYGPRSRGRTQPNPGLNMLIIISDGGWEIKDAVGALGHLVDMEDYFAAPTILVYTQDEWFDREGFASSIFYSVSRSYVRV